MAKTKKAPEREKFDLDRVCTPERAAHVRRVYKEIWIAAQYGAKTDLPDNEQESYRIIARFMDYIERTAETEPELSDQEYEDAAKQIKSLVWDDAIDVLTPYISRSSLRSLAEDARDTSTET